MSARSLVTCSFEPAVKQTVPDGCKAREGADAEIGFREALWHEYRLEAINAGFAADQATAYASALSSEMGLVAVVSEMAPVGRGWFYRSRAVVVRRTITSGRIELAHLGKSKSAVRTAVASLVARGFRWWNAEAKAEAGKDDQE